VCTTPWSRCVAAAVVAFASPLTLSCNQHFEDFFDDQHDFFIYTLRKTMMRACVDMVRTHDNIFAHKFFVRAATSAIECYLELHNTALAAERDLAGASGGAAWLRRR
jgi:hypothetical protein